MNLSLQEGDALTRSLLEQPALQSTRAQVVLFTPFVHLADTVRTLKQADSRVEVGAQNCHPMAQGAYTGEISAAMLSSTGAGWCLVGHSERREYFHESNELLATKVNALLTERLVPVYCCGETRAQREAGEHFTVIERQLREGLFHLASEQMDNVVIAYEPVWAIGTGLTASAAQAQEVHAHIRQLLQAQYGSLAERTRILYGGSMKPGNAAELLAQPDIDGGLIGGASLVAEDFAGIVAAVQQA